MKTCKSKIFRKTILVTDQNLDLILSCEEKDTFVGDHKIESYKNNDLIFNSDLEFIFKDPWTSTHHGQFKDRSLFRLIRP